MALKRSRMKRSTKRLTPEYKERKREVLERDGECQFADCTVPAVSYRCDVHHIRTGGGDGLDNLVTLCNDFAKGHHTWVHANRRKAEVMGLRKSGNRIN
jgi:hypothetical protein|tara:strand:- start:308 stop:604 length:297 start_codon:yes stop_codon:yes gene_type:complete